MINRKTISTTRKHHPVLLSPLTMEIANTVMVAVIAPIGFIVLEPALVNENAYIQTFLIWMLFFAMVILGWLLSPRLGTRYVYNAYCNITMGFTHKDIRPQHLRILTYTCFGLFLLNFVALMVFSGMGTLWLTAPRLAYQSNGATGAGTFYVTTSAFLTLSYLLSLFIATPAAKRSPKFDLALKTLFFMTCAYFLGSKGEILSMVIGSLAYYNYVIAPLRFTTFLFFGVLLVCGFTVLIIMGATSTGGEGNAVSALLYFDYFHNTSEFLRRFDEFGGYKFGGIYLSDFWVYVPRVLYPDKPKLWGQMVINNILFPGAADIGYTPAESPWAGMYLDFGLVGVVVAGLLHGLGIGWVHHFFRARPTNPIRYLLLMQMSKIVAVSAFLPFSGFLLVLFVFILVIRLIGNYFAVLVSPTNLSLHHKVTHPNA